MKKKFFIVLAVCVFAFLGLAANTYATENMEVFCEVKVDHKDLIQNQKKVVDNWDSVKKTLNAKSTGKNFLATPGVSSELEEVIVNAVKTRSTLTYIDSFGLNTSTFDTNAITYVLNDHPELFYCGGILTYYDTTTGDILAIAPQYTYDEATTNEILESLAEYKANVFVNLDSDMNDVEKLMVAHDFIIKTCDYDYDRLNSDTLIAQDFTLVGVLDGLAVCQGYTMMLKYLLDEMGIESTYVYSVDMNHIWNAVEINGKYYHVDSTWTDPGEYYFAEVNRTYFLKGDDYFENNANHYSWECGVSNFGTAYDNYFWNSNIYFFAYANDYWYYVKDANTLVKVDLRNNAATTEISVPNMYNYATRYYLASDGKNLYCMDEDAISRINLKTLEIEEYFFMSFEENQYFAKMTNLTPNIILFSYEDDTTYWVDYFEVYPITGVEFSVDSIDLELNETEQLSWEILPAERTEDASILITTSNKNVVTIDENGTITAVGAGTATITITINDEYTDTITVTVTEPNTDEGSGDNSGEGTAGLMGDVDGNGRVTVKDARLVVEHVIGTSELTEEQKLVADIDENSVITVRDARKILEIVLN